MGTTLTLPLLLQFFLRPLTFAFSVTALLSHFSGDVLRPHAPLSPPARKPAPALGGGVCKLIVEKQGYLCQEHSVTTEDGYILSLQRIPWGHSNEYSQANRPPVLLQHGVLMDGVTWMLNSAEQSLAFILADNGFDVWIANSRGTQLSLSHTSLSSADPAYWDWTWDELVAYDLPATVKYIYDHSHQKLHFVGHSQGTLIVLAAFSEVRLLDMVRSAALLSPVAYLSRMTSPLAKDAIDNFIGEFIYWLGLHQFVPRGEEVMKLVKEMCSKPGIDCTDLLTSFTGENCCVSKSTVPTFLEHEPQSTSTKNMIHLAQMARDGTVAKYRYENQSENVKHYGQAEPPEYNLTNLPIELPLFFAYGGRDALADVDDVQTLLQTLKGHDVDKLYVLYLEDYAHADFVMAINAKQFVYNPLVAFLKSHDSDLG